MLKEALGSTFHACLNYLVLDLAGLGPFESICELENGRKFPTNVISMAACYKKI